MMCCNAILSKWPRSRTCQSRRHFAEIAKEPPLPKPLPLCRSCQGVTLAKAAHSQHAVTLRQVALEALRAKARQSPSAKSLSKPSVPKLHRHRAKSLSKPSVPNYHSRQWPKPQHVPQPLLSLRLRASMTRAPTCVLRASRNQLAIEKQAERY